MPRIPVKSTEKLAFAAERGRLLAQRKVHQSKPIFESLREHIGKALDRIDPIELAALLAGTVIVHTTITTSADLFKRVTANVTVSFRGAQQALIEGKPVSGSANYLGGVLGVLSVFAPFTGDTFKNLGEALTTIGGANLEDPSKPGVKKSDIERQIQDFLGSIDGYVWLVSFVVAYLGIKNAGKIGASIPGVSNILSLLGL